MSQTDKTAEAVGKAAADLGQVCYFHVQYGGHTYKDVATTIGNAYTALTGDNRGAAAGRVVDSLTSGVTVDLDSGKIRHTS